MSPRPCTAPGCPRLVPGSSKGSRCEAHKPKAWATSEGRSASERGYGGNWSRLRGAVLAREPLCRACRAAGVVCAASVVDHVVPKAEGGTDAWENLQPLCRRCHDLKSQQEAKRGRERNG